MFGMQLVRLYIDDVKRNVHDFKDRNRFGTVLNTCGYYPNVGKCESVNACSPEYHASNV